LLSGKSVANNVVNEPDLPQYQSTATVSNREVHDADLQKTWKEYASVIAKEKPHIHSILINRIPVLKNGTEITVELISQSQEIEFMKEKEQLISFLKQKLQNSNLRLFTIISKEVSSEIATAITSSEKLKAMMTKNPAVAKLLIEFSLDIE
jgi:DNA polymerase-3 subunit gamma/tau